MSFDTLFSKLTLYREKAVKKKNHFTVNTTVKVKMCIKHQNFNHEIKNVSLSLLEGKPQGD